MKKIIFISIGIFIAAVLGILLIRNKAPETDVTRKVTNVGLILPGKCQDKSFGQTHYDSLMAIKKELNLNIVVMEDIAEDESSYKAMEELIKKEDCRIIIASSFGYGEYVKKAAEEYGDIYFLHATGSETLSNLSSYMGRMYQARYLSGIVAGLQTDSGEIGYVAAFPIPEVIRGINAFTLGVKSVRRDARVHVKYCESWTDDEAGRAASIALLDEFPIDVITMHTNSLEPHREADKRGVWSIGYNMDNSADFPNTYLTACEWNWEFYYRDQILSFLQGKAYGNNEWISMEDGIVRLSKLTENVKEGAKEAVEKEKKRLESRSFDVFYGPVSDNEGKLRVEEGEAMSDDEMLNGFDWYVDGVELYD